MTATTADRLAAELAGIRERASQLTDDGHATVLCTADLGGPCTGHDAERLADAAEALLTQAARWDDEAAALDKRAEGQHPAAAAVLMCARAQALTDLAGQVRDVITASLLGEDGTCPSCREDAHSLCSAPSVSGNDLLCCCGLVIDRRTT